MAVCTQLFAALPVRLAVVTSLVATAALSGCNPKSDLHQHPAHTAKQVPIVTASEKSRTANPAWPLGEAILTEGVNAARELNKAVTELLATPTMEKLDQAQNAWRATAAALEQFHVFSRLGNVAPKNFYSVFEAQFLLTAWPIQPGYLDSFGDHPYSGIVFDIGMPLSRDVLREQHGLTDNSDATLGIYAIEFLLFGEQNNRGPLVFQPITALGDEHREEGFEHVDELPRNRRRELLRLQVELLTEDAERLRAAWAATEPGQLQYRFEVLSSAQQSELLQKAALALVTEQLVALANEQPAANTPTISTDLWRGQQLAVRLQAQLEGLRRLNSVVSLGDQVERDIARGLAALTAQTDLPPINAQGLPNRVDWKETYSALRDLIRALNSPADNSNSSEMENVSETENATPAPNVKNADKM